MVPVSRDPVSVSAMTLLRSSHHQILFIAFQKRANHPAMTRKPKTTILHHHQLLGRDPLPHVASLQSPPQLRYQMLFLPTTPHSPTVKLRQRHRQCKTRSVGPSAPLEATRSPAGVHLMGATGPLGPTECGSVCHIPISRSASNPNLPTCSPRPWS